MDSNANEEFYNHFFPEKFVLEMIFIEIDIGLSNQFLYFIPNRFWMMISEIIKRTKKSSQISVNWL